MSALRVLIAARTALKARARRAVRRRRGYLQPSTAKFCLGWRREAVQAGCSCTCWAERRERGLPARARRRAAARALGGRAVLVCGDAGCPGRHRPGTRAALARAARAVHRG